MIINFILITRNLNNIEIRERESSLKARKYDHTFLIISFSWNNLRIFKKEDLNKIFLFNVVKENSVSPSLWITKASSWMLQSKVELRLRRLFRVRESTADETPRRILLAHPFSILSSEIFRDNRHLMVIQRVCFDLTKNNRSSSMIAIENRSYFWLIFKRLS